MRKTLSISVLAFLLLFFYNPAHSGTDKDMLNLIKLSKATEDGAVCLDGSPAEYYLRRGDKNSGLWVIVLAGGGMCRNAQECGSRAKEQQKNQQNQFPPVKPGQGIQSSSSSENPDFHKANQVFIPYCSLDLWSGDRNASDDTHGAYFRGSKIFRSVVKELMDSTVTASPNLAEATDVLLAGMSSGGIGVLVHLDWLAGQLPKANVRGLDDAGWIVVPDSTETQATQKSAKGQQAFSLWNGVVDVTCAEANPGAESKCYTSAVYPYISTPLFVHISQFDDVISHTEKATNLQSFGELVRKSLEPVQAAFSPADHNHTMIQGAFFYNLRVNGQSLRDLVGNWFFGRKGPTKIVAEK